jgi:hypothetical protein
MHSGCRRAHQKALPSEGLFYFNCALHRKRQPQRNDPSNTAASSDKAIFIGAIKPQQSVNFNHILAGKLD